ncbi:4-hydroxy-3-methylbut-2-enyl diphosphate reductase, putative [Plasmodium vivax]|uniref:4-hydroxy-3-methylbut-2-enyl diphosphate reductase n=6 Tax=Plasmodium vivax TaxID=5855 RepID=A5K9W7_PLAVS|nr:4-hydroxy-3-methylbut-2-enyl diphosphate reductase, putative [Plasmodium vivax]KMZ82757.1 4-hydroxy-3-methylbut-2-enyl diphosphate reductase [Plasmodium vivax India VII]KMZ89254.1 4-hydroxy-3-methylbut-2-enyl diphosphate reductase [Plasmodium vivax Brazil I]KMZ95576.1 4-hydroxy-3-methylbut-2-enyl diphosphate reductase [Plasmodium vivax Mauritania I]KNA02040.1 4-hydroxy-3-methylbut-2-enyl diphosphate reductase [Plasmodium vivax North Korean]EDL43855.1 4-hydroxy-3-methylbut-2-enyl diphosphate|eukprot:XP_001613582.1 4-hydroxy-3-methylbut-2-enyl diphosphate reductase [Plasmodium vivax Sal-1]
MAGAARVPPRPLERCLLLILVVILTAAQSKRVEHSLRRGHLRVADFPSGRGSNPRGKSYPNFAFLNGTVRRPPEWRLRQEGGHCSSSACGGCGCPKTTQSSGGTPVEGEKVLYLVSPRGFCKGVSRAIDTVEECLRMFKPPIYVKHKIVHNDIVCKQLEEKGAIFIEDVNEVPDGNILIYSAHGISPQIRELAQKKKLIEIDATCPLVNKVHVYVQVKAKEGYKIILIGYRNHVEVVGTFNEAPDSTYIVENVNQIEELPLSEKDKLFYVTQTTLSIDDCSLIVKRLKEKFPHIETIPSGSICYATTNRQMALNQICQECDLTIVVGSQSSSNAKKLVYSSQLRNTPAVLVNSVDDFDFSSLSDVRKIALTSAASTPEELTQKFVQVLTGEPFRYTLRLFEPVRENVPKWKLPKNLMGLIEERGKR